MKLNENKNLVGSVVDPYGESYLKWKAWGAEFANLKKTEAAYFKAEIDRTDHKFPEKSKVLEIGFGNGKFLKYAREKGWDIFGTEVNEALVDAAQEAGFVANHTDNLSNFKDDTFDLIIAFDVLEHIPQDFLPIFITEIKRVLKDGGYFIARFPNGDSPLGLINQNGDVTHVTTIGSGKAHYFANKANMKVVFVGGEAQPLLGTSCFYFMHQIFTYPIKKTINLFVNLIFFPRQNVEFCSPNLTMIYQAIK